jgi:hypothetical protein
MQKSPYHGDGVAQSTVPPIVEGITPENGIDHKVEKILINTPEGKALHPGIDEVYRYTGRYARFSVPVPIALLGQTQLPEADLWEAIVNKIKPGDFATGLPNPINKGASTFRLEKTDATHFKVTVYRKGKNTQMAPILSRHRINELMIELIRKYWP